jgi:hypothetical protein
VRNRPGSCAAPSSATEHSCQPAAPQLPAFLGDQAAPHSVRADAERVPERKLQAVRPHWTPGADRDGPGGLFPRLPHVRGEREPLVRLQARSGARACRYTRPNSSRSFGSPDRHCTGRGETVVTTGCTSSRSSPLQPHRRAGRPHPPTGWLTRLVIPAGRTIQVRDAATADFLQSRISKGYRLAAVGRRGLRRRRGNGPDTTYLSGG